MKILVSYRGIPQSRGWATGDFVIKAFQALGHEAVPCGNYYQTSERLEGTRRVLDESWDLYLQMECGDGDPFYSELIGVNAKKRATWWFDIALYPDRWERQTSLVKPDINFVANRNYVSGSNTVYLPYAADREKHFRPLDFPKSRDFALIGSDRPERRELIQCLQKAGCDAHLITNVFREEYINTLASTRYVINDVAGGGNGLIPMRLQETMVAGSVLLTAEDIGLSFFGESGKHFLVYNNIDHLLEIIRSEEYKITPVAQNHCLNNHLYIHRCKTILDVI